MYASLEKFCTALPAAKLNGRPTLSINNAGIRSLNDMSVAAQVQTQFKSGFIAIVGQPNVGKSTLLNRILQYKLAIVSPKPQTTRNRILGILNRDEAQLIFWDTPGIYKPKRTLDKRMVAAAYQSLKQVDVVLFMIQAGPRVNSDEDKRILRALADAKIPVFLIINKIDLVDKSELLPRIDYYRQLFNFRHIIPICAMDGSGVDDLLGELIEVLPAGPRYFPPDMITDQPERFIMAEIVREQLYRFTHQEVPYSTAVMVEEMREGEGKRPIYMRGMIYVEHNSQKKIIIGHAGEMIKRIGQSARREMEQLLGSQVYLDLWVKVRKDWRESQNLLNALGY
jgi:GTP-binding protein Era